jgi:Ca-activated chloride channel family protein
MAAPVLEPVEDGKIALQSVRVDARIEDLLCEVTTRQVYSNLEKVNIEAVYTFPLPLGAVFLDMAIKTSTKQLKGIVVEKREAEDRYENAVTDGDTAIMLERTDAGLYTMNVGNLLPEETIEISITYAELLTWRDNSLRFFLPTTVAPRYADPAALGIQPHQTPEHDLMVENRFSLEVSIRGALARASIESPSHKILSKSSDDEMVVSLKTGRALMDRDFVLNIVMPAGDKSFAHLEKDGDGYIALASFYPKFPTVSDDAPRCITIIVDCSGSMNGDSIAQACAALSEILGLLRPMDRFNIVRFGSSHEKLFPSPVLANGANLKKARSLLEVLEANMGGTEIGPAVSAAIKVRGLAESRKDVLLITDGEVWDWQKVTAMAAKSGFRFFTVGVGASVSEAFVQRLAHATGGACELVAPNEDMAQKIVRHFKRIYLPKTAHIEIKWPLEPVKNIPGKIGSLFDGDTLHVFARFDQKPEGKVTLEAEMENGRAFAHTLPIQIKDQSAAPGQLPGTAARMAAAFEISELMGDGEVEEFFEEPDLSKLFNVDEIKSLALKYQLMSRHTNYLAIDARPENEKAEDLPALRKTPQMLAAGWGGLGTVMKQKVSTRLIPEILDFNSLSVSDEPVFLRRKIELSESFSACERFDGLREEEPADFIDRLNQTHEGFLSSVLPSSRNRLVSVVDLEALGIPTIVLEALTALVEEGADERSIVATFLYLLGEEEQIKDRLSRTTRRILAKTYKQLPPVSADIRSQIQEAVSLYIETTGN